MPRYDVHIYQPWRLKFVDIEAADPQAAILAALDLKTVDAQETEAEGCPTDALVDRLDETGALDEASGECSLNSDLIYGEGDEPRIVPAINNTPACNHPAGDNEARALAAFAREILGAIRDIEESDHQDGLTDFYDLRNSLLALVGKVLPADELAE